MFKRKEQEYNIFTKFYKSYLSLKEFIEFCIQRILIFLPLTKSNCSEWTERNFVSIGKVFCSVLMEWPPKPICYSWSSKKTSTKFQNHKEIAQINW